LITDHSVRGEVVLAAQEVVIDPGDARPGDVDAVGRPLGGGGRLLIVFATRHRTPPSRSLKIKWRLA
jgi:hypothetical protein